MGRFQWKNNEDVKVQRLERL